METSFHFSEPVESPGLSGKRSQSICPAEVFLDSTHQINETTLQSPRIAHTHRVWPIEPHHHHVASSEASNYHAGSLTRRGSSPVLSPLRSTAHNDDAKDSPTDFLQTTSTLNLSKPVETPGLPGKSLQSICSSEAFPDPTHQLNEIPLQISPTLRMPSSSVSSKQGPSRSLLSIYYQNVRGLRTKANEFLISTYNDDYDIIVLTETWLSDEFTSRLLFGEHYSVYRCDRDPLTTGKNRGGGTLIAISNKWPSQRVSTLALTNNFEQVWAKITTSSNYIFVGVVYLSPDIARNEQFMNEHLDHTDAIVEQMHPRDMMYLFGDYNQPNLIWTKHTKGFSKPDPTLSQFSSASSALLDRTALLDLKQINHVSNQNSRFLDLLFVNETALGSSCVHRAPESITKDDQHHPPLVVHVSEIQIVPFQEHFQQRSLNFKKTNFELLNVLLSVVDWNYLETAPTIDHAVGKFTETVNQLFKNTVPHHRPLLKPPWTNRRLKYLKRTRASTLKYFSQHRNPCSKLAFNSASNAYRKYNRFLYLKYIARTENNLKRNPKKFWSFVNEKRNECGLPKSMFLSDETCDSPTDQCELFSKHFASVFSD